ncbi:FtsX-like permease family protein [Micromonospora olivasterospora]|uniref:Putative ABC transport system permease protein n=1 Tax=Micromonospora olivasterospora TaxID=1880 RepID=A0A562IDH9_MICOL|nr:FtsX-like permease family protein [Micromonospora olivasterospora]TWH68906.1 putative ABC transport system permease protein [Micromonospora olivasterospora]
MSRELPDAAPAGAAGRPGRCRQIVAALRSWRAALRIARREARRARGRTALVLAMIALPVLALTFVAVSYDMSELTRSERVDRLLGAADAELRWYTDGPLAQDAWGDTWYARDGVPSRVRPATFGEVAPLLPAGSRVAEVRRWLSFEVRVGDGYEPLVGHVLDLTEPLLRGHARLVRGRAPAGPDEVALNRAALRRLHVRVGGRVAPADGSGQRRVVGEVEFADTLRAAVALPPASGSSVDPQAEVSWLVELPGGPDPGLVERLNARGIVVAARTANPAAEPGLDAPLSAEDAGNAVLIGGLGLLEVVLLVGPAFAVGVRRRRRDLALVAVAGGDAAHLRRVVLADGVVLGCAGAAAGLTLGVAAAFAARPLVEEYVVQARFGAYRVFPAALAALAAVAVLAGVLAALAPAWTAARQDVLAGLAGRRTPPPHRRRWPLVGVLLAAGGAALAALGAARTSTPVLLAGVVIGELGLVFATPTLIGLLALAGRWLPLAPRIALRDASRNRSSAAPAISAVMAAVAGSVALGGYVASDEARDRANYRPGLPYGHVVVIWNGPDGPGKPPPVARVAALAATELPPSSVAGLDSPVCAAPSEPGESCQVRAVLPPGRACPYRTAAPRDPAARDRAQADPRCARLATGYSGGFSAPGLIDDGDALAGLTGTTPEEVAAARRVLRAGGVVVGDPQQVLDGRVTLSAVRSRDDSSSVASRTTTVPGYALRGTVDADLLVLSPAAATRLGLAAQRFGYVLDTAAAPTPAQQNRFATALRPLGPMSVDVERGPGAGDQRPLLLLLAIGSGLITVGAAAVATGLAAAEGRADLSTLAAVGASPRMRRVLSLWQAGVIAVLGSALGMVAGLGTGAIILTALNRRDATAWPVVEPYPLVVPWLTLGVLTVVPLAAMLGAGLFTRSRLAVGRRLD